MRTPIAWIWLSVWVRLLVCGNAYCGIYRGDVRQAAVVAGVVARTCAAIRQEGQ